MSWVVKTIFTSQSGGWVRGWKSMENRYWLFALCPPVLAAWFWWVGSRQATVFKQLLVTLQTLSPVVYDTKIGNKFWPGNRLCHASKLFEFWKGILWGETLSNFSAYWIEFAFFPNLFWYDVISTATVLELACIEKFFSCILLAISTIRADYASFLGKFALSRVNSLDGLKT